MVRKMGDYGDVAVALRREADDSQRHDDSTKMLTLESIVFAAERMIDFSGDDSIKMKLDLMVNLCR